MKRREGGRGVREREERGCGRGRTRRNGEEGKLGGRDEERGMDVWRREGRRREGVGLTLDVHKIESMLAHIFVCIVGHHCHGVTPPTCVVGYVVKGPHILSN